MNKTVRAFVIGSSFVTALPFELAVILMGQIDYKKYSFAAPLYFGVMNVISAWLFPDEITLSQRLWWTSIFSILFVLGLVRVTKPYPFVTKMQWVEYATGLCILHLFVWNYIIAFLEKAIPKEIA